MLKKESIWSPLLCWIIIYLLWAMWLQWGANVLPNAPASALLEAAVIKNLLWLGPVIPLLRRKNDWYIPLRQMFALPPAVPCLAMLCASAAFLHTVRILGGKLHTIVFFDPIFVALSLCAGITEEIVFRGILFNCQAKAMGTTLAALLNGALFALIHYPGLFFGRDWAGLISARTLMLFVMGGLLCKAFERWRSLPLTMTVHAVWNLLSFLFGLSG